MEKPAIAGGTPVRNTKLFYGHQYLDEADYQAVLDVLRSGNDLTCGPKIGELEEKLCRVTGAKYAVAVSNGTAALHVACLAAGIGEGDEVITTPITFAASANCALYCGARPVFADIDEKTWNIDPASVRERITERTKAVVAVDFTGQSAQLDELLSICHEKGILLITDGAHSIGTKYKGRPTGSIADMTTFSFHPVKTVTAGEGGAVTTNDPAFYEKLSLYRAHGITRNPALMEKQPDGPWYYEQVALGYNYRMTDIQAALLIQAADEGRPQAGGRPGYQCDIHANASLPRCFLYCTPKRAAHASPPERRTGSPDPLRTPCILFHGPAFRRPELFCPGGSFDPPREGLGKMLYGNPEICAEISVFLTGRTVVKSGAAMVR